MRKKEYESIKKTRNNRRQSKRKKKIKQKK